MSFLNTHRLHWSAHHGPSVNLHEHLDLLMHKDVGEATAPADPKSEASGDTPTEMPSQIINPPSSQRELGS